MPGATPMKPGSATYPFFGVNPVILDSDGRVIEGPGEGNLCFDRAWPGMLRTVFGDHDRYVPHKLRSLLVSIGRYFLSDS